MEGVDFDFGCAVVMIMRELSHVGGAAQGGNGGDQWFCAQGWWLGGGLRTDGVVVMGGRPRCLTSFDTSPGSPGEAEEGGPTEDSYPPSGQPPFIGNYDLNLQVF